MGHSPHFTKTGRNGNNEEISLCCDGGDHQFLAIKVMNRKLNTYYTSIHSIVALKIWKNLSQLTQELN